MEEKIKQVSLLREAYIRGALSLTDNLLELPTMPTKAEAIEILQMYIGIAENTNVTCATVGATVGIKKATMSYYIGNVRKPTRYKSAKGLLNVAREYARQLRIFYGYY